MYIYLYVCFKIQGRKLNWYVSRHEHTIVYLSPFLICVKIQLEHDFIEAVRYVSHKKQKMKLTLLPPKPIHSKSFIILAGKSEIIRLKEPTPIRTPLSKSLRILSSFQERSLRIVKQVLKKIVQVSTIQYLIFIVLLQLWHLLPI